ncbi:Transmembrane protein [Parasponia andersonii]|uniref:Transmembrane protein n=1 Tax=Parasponia andersonii TaxID=3476 RepID=A0A2P5ANI6_PARAD|nr:Transmembrane protein [Parasponia andersonii]
MDQIQNQDLPSDHDAKFNKHHFLRRTLQVVLSVSLLSLFICYSHGVSCFPHSFSVYFSTRLFSLFAHTLERKYMFLICNGILAFLAKASVSSSYDSSYADGTTAPPSKLSADIASKAAVLVADDEDQVVDQSSDGVDFIGDEEEEQQTTEDEEGVEKADEEQGKNSQALSSTTSSSTDDENGNEEEDREISGCGVSSNKQEANDEELISTDELNKKIEEFIRKMKEEIRIEAQRQLIAV